MDHIFNRPDYCDLIDILFKSLPVKKGTSTNLCIVGCGYSLGRLQSHFVYIESTQRVTTLPLIITGVDGGPCSAIPDNKNEKVTEDEQRHGYH